MAISKMQREFIDNANHRFNIKTGATRSGKTYIDYMYVIPKRIRDRIDKDGLSLILGVTKSTIERNVLEPMRKEFGADLVGEISSNNTCYMFGECVYCLGAEKISQVSKLRGSSVKYCYGDEVADWAQEVFDMLKSRLDKPYSCFDGALNPQSPNHWLKKFIDSDADIYCQKYTIFDNPFLDKAFVDNLCKEYSGSVYYKRYILGDWAIADGLVYGMFSRENNVFSGPVPYNQNSRYDLAIDYGTMNPFAVGLMELTQDGVVRLIRRGGHRGREDGTTLDNEAYYKIIKEVAGDFPITTIVIDPSAAGMKATIRKYGEYTTTDGNNDVLNGIQEVTKYINAGYLLVHDSCTDTLNEFEAYAWDDKVTDKDQVIKESDHDMDFIRYYIYTVARRYNKGII